jgi:cardiolipin synthase (CMP-forming)
LRQVPNFISSIRVLLVIPIAVALLHHDFATTLGLFGVAALSDAADGFLAKRFGWQTDVGAVLDPAADKLLLATVFVLLAILRLVPLWLMAAVVARDLIIVSGAVAYRMCFGPIEARPSLVSKLNTLSQVVLILAIVVREQLATPTAAAPGPGALTHAWPAAWIVTLLGALTLVTVVVSGIDYVLRYGRRALEEAKSRRAVWRAGGSNLT